MKHGLAVACAILCVASCGLFAQGPSSSSTDATPTPESVLPSVGHNSYSGAPFSRMGFGVGISPLGIGMQVSTNLNQHLNLRGVGNVFQYSTNFTVSGVPSSAKLNLGTGGALVDYYPWHVGFRLSGGLLFVNDNQLTATSSVAGGSSITLNHQDYYSSTASPLTGSGNLALNTRKPSGVLTTGWGNHVKHSGHISFPFEIGVAFVGAPKVNMSLSGVACTDSTQTQCSNVADPNSPIAQQFQSNLSAQIAKWNSDLNVLQVYPIISTGISYSFGIRSK